MSSTYSHIMERRSPKSPLPRSPMPKSPFPKSPMPQSPEFYEKYKSKCAYGLVNFFHFRQSYSKKLISDKPLSKRHAVEMRNLEEEDMPIKQQIKKTTAKVKHVQSDSELVGDRSTSHRQAIKTNRKPRRLPIYGCYDVATMGHAKSVHENSVDNSLKKLESAVRKESLSNQVQPNTEIDCKFRSVPHQRHGQFKDINLQIRMNEATEAFINQKLIDGNHLSTDGANDQSKHFMDALEILNSNKDLFIKLLQDPNSLLMKHIEDLRGSQSKVRLIESYPEDKSPEKQKSNSEECEQTVCNQNSISSDRYLSKGTGDPQPLDTIVVLRPGSTSLQNCTGGISHDSSPVRYSLKNVQQSVKPSFFPFVKMKRKLMDAMGVSRKEQQLMLTDGAVQKSKYNFQDSEKCAGGPGEHSCSFGSTTRDVRSEEQMDKVELIESSVKEEAATASEKGHESSKFSYIGRCKETSNDKYVETRVYLSDILENGNVSLSRKQRPKTWNGMTSLPENEFLPTVSPRCQVEHDCVTPQMRFSPYNSYQMVNKNKRRSQSEKRNNVSPPQQNLVAPPWIDDKSFDDQSQIMETKEITSDKLFLALKEDGNENISSLENDSTPGGSTNIIGQKGSKISEEYIPSGVPYRLDGSHNTHANASTFTANTTAECESSKIFRPDSSGENQMSPSSKSDCLSSPLNIQRVEDLDKAKERLKQPSPISVLEQFFMEDMISSPSSNTSRPAELSTQPLKLGNEKDYLAALFHSPLDLKINSSTSLEEREFVFGYIGAVLRASGFNLDDISSKCHSQSCGDHKLVCDYFVEVLLEVYQYYLRSAPWLSFVEPKFQLVTMAENMVQQVMKYVDRNMLLRPPSQTLEHCVEKHLTNSTTWLDVRIDAEDVVSMIVESVLEEVIMETAIG